MSVSRARLVALACAGLAVAMLVAPHDARAATNGSGSDTLSVTGGSLSVASTGAASFALALGNGTVTTAATSLNAATYADLTGGGAGWNATLAVQQFVNTQAWVATGAALLTNSAGTYTATTLSSSYDVAVTADGGTTVTISWSGLESGSGTATKGTPLAVGTHGITITFNGAVTYLTADRYSVRVGALPTTALTMAAGGSCTAQGTTAGGANLPAMANTSATVVGGTYNTFGTALKVVSAATGTGIGSFTCTPKATITVDSNTTWASAYTAVAQFSIVSGP